MDILQVKWLNKKIEILFLDHKLNGDNLYALDLTELLTRLILGQIGIVKIME